MNKIKTPFFLEKDDLDQDDKEVIQNYKTGLISFCNMSCNWVYTMECKANRSIAKITIDSFLTKIMENK